MLSGLWLVRAVVCISALISTEQASGWNFFIYEALTVPFEIAALNILLGFWRDDIPPTAVCLTAIALYT